MPCRSPGQHPGGEVEGSGGSPGPHPGGCVSQHALRQTSPLQTATAVDGRHPTGMHSCFVFVFANLRESNNFMDFADFEDICSQSTAFMIAFLFTQYPYVLQCHKLNWKHLYKLDCAIILSN